MVIVIVWIAFIRLEQKTNLNYIKKYVKIKMFLMIVLKILEFNQYQESDKIHLLFMQILNLWSKRTDGCKKNPVILFTIKVGEYIPFNVYDIVI